MLPECCHVGEVAQPGDDLDQALTREVVLAIIDDQHPVSSGAEVVDRDPVHAVRVELLELAL